jgi:hypothetical protein
VARAKWQRGWDAFWRTITDPRMVASYPGDVAVDALDDAATMQLDATPAQPGNFHQNLCFIFPKDSALAQADFSVH